MCKKIKVFPEEVNTIYKDGIVYVSMSEYFKVVKDNVLLHETLKDVCQRGVSDVCPPLLPDFPDS